MKRLLLIFIMLLSGITSGYAQQSTYNWYFGRQAGITFKPNGTNPTAIIDCPLNFSNSCAVISDDNANLLFYSNGNVINSHNHMQMDGSFNLTTFYSNPEGTTIVPWPGHTKQYFMFSTDSNVKTGLWYSLINMADNNGFGKVISWYRQLSNRRTANVEAVPHRNGKDIWLVTRGYLVNRFDVYLISSAGISSPVISYAGPNDSTVQLFINSSPDCRKLAGAGYGDSSFTVYDFDNSTGVVSNAMRLYDPSFRLPIAVEFSGDGTKLYGSCKTTANSCSIFQFNLTLGAPSEIIAAKYEVYRNNGNDNYEAMQIGPDRKIYVSLTGDYFLSVINRPNNSGAGCNFQIEQVYLNARNCYFGLPDFIYNYYNLGIGATDSVCVGGDIGLFADAPDTAVFSWTGPNGFSSNQKNPVIPNADFDMSGFYRCRITNLPVTFDDSVYVVVVPIPKVKLSISPDSMVCKGISVKLTVNISGPVSKIRWSTGDSVSSITVKKEGTYSVVVKGVLGCTDSTSVNISYYDGFKGLLETPEGRTACDGDSLKLIARPNDSRYKIVWSNNSKDSVIFAKTAGHYSAIIEDDIGCKDTVGCDITFNPKPILTIKRYDNNDKCIGDSLQIAVGSGAAIHNVVWSNGDTTSWTYIKNNGRYYVTAENSFGCKGIDSIDISFLPPPSFIISPKSPYYFCKGDSVDISVVSNDPSLNCYWSNGAKTRKTNVKQPGVYYVKGVDRYGCSRTDSIFLYYNPPIDSKITASGPIEFCFGDSVILTGEPFGGKLFCQWSNGAKTRSITVKSQGVYRYIVTDSIGCTDIASIIVNVAQNLSASIVGDNYICPRKTVTLTAKPTNPAYRYLWSTGETTPLIYVSSAGQYWVKVALGSNCSDSANFTLLQANSPEARIISSSDGKLCVGDSLLLASENTDDSLTYKWSTGETTPSIIIKESGNYKLLVTNEFGCSDSAFYSAKFYEQPKAKITSNGPISLCYGDSTELAAEIQPDSCNYLWSTGETSTSIIVKSSGTYYLTASINPNCFSVDSAIVTVNTIEVPVIKGDSMICNGQTGKIGVVQTYAGYNWNNGETTQSIIITSPGQYTVTVSNAEGCKSYSGYIVKAPEFIIDGFNDLNFGKTKKNVPLQKSLTITNKSITDLRITTISAKDFPNVFSISSLPALPAVIKQGETLIITITFLPDENKIYNDSLILLTDQPCYFSASVFLTGSAGAATIVSMPDTTGLIGDANFCFPLKAVMTENFEPTQPLNFTALIKFDATVFKPDNLYSGYILGTECFVPLSGNDVQFVNGGAKLTEMCGTILLATNDYTPIFIDKFEWNDAGIEVTKDDGSLTLTGVCSRELSRIVLFTPQAISLSPNPASTTINIEFAATVNSGECNEIKIFDIYGRLYDCQKELSGSSKSMKIDIGNLPQGVYTLRFDHITKIFTVIK